MTVAFLGLSACASPRTRPLVAVATTESASVTAPLVHRSCIGPHLCREDIVASDDRGTIADLDDDCAHRGGTSSSTRCVQDGALATCSLNGSGLGSIVVYAYAESEASTVARHCDDVEGTLERPSRTIAAE